MIGSRRNPCKTVVDAGDGGAVLVSFTSLGALLRSPVHPNPSRVSPGVSPRSCFAGSGDDGVRYVATFLKASSWRPWLLVVTDGSGGWRWSVVDVDGGAAGLGSTVGLCSSSAMFVLECSLVCLC